MTNILTFECCSWIWSIFIFRKTQPQNWKHI